MEVTTIFIILFILVIVFLVLREFWCWYWKVNKGIAELEKLNDNMETIKSLLIQCNSSSFKDKKITGNSDEELPDL